MNTKKFNDRPSPAIYISEAMMDVYILICGDMYEGISDIVDVFLTKESALAQMQEKATKDYLHNLALFEEMKKDEPYCCEKYGVSPPTPFVLKGDSMTSDCSEYYRVIKRTLVTSERPHNT